MQTDETKNESQPLPLGAVSGSFTCKGCSHKLTSNYQMKTEGYCYLCDPNITVHELLEDDDENEFQCCAECDLPDACADFGCAIKSGIRSAPEW